ncbi:hypothetical protein F5887DRAFT_1290309 [Amanita rubescens]|nr:hypothetical protein F5887DRAFT_1290309 [Amanita rubescens]
MNTNLSYSQNLLIWTRIKRLPAPEYRCVWDGKLHRHHVTVYIQGEPFGEAMDESKETAQEDAAFQALFNPELATGFKLLYTGVP